MTEVNSGNGSSAIIATSSADVTMTTTEAVATPIPELGKLGGEAIEKYTEAAAVHIEQVGQDLFKIADHQCAELLKLATHHEAECRKMAGEMREAAKLMAAQTVDFTSKVMSATTEVTALMDKAQGEVAAIRARFAPTENRA